MIKPGHILEYDISTHTISSSEYFNFTHLIDESLYKAHSKESSKSILDTFDTLLNASIKRRLVADVPVATINSGGID